MSDLPGQLLFPFAQQTPHFPFPAGLEHPLPSGMSSIPSQFPAEPGKNSIVPGNLYRNICKSKKQTRGGAERKRKLLLNSCAAEFTRAAAGNKAKRQEQ